VIRLVVPLAFVVGCGRLDFGEVSDGGLADGSSDTVQAVGHDEDGDGIDDALDTCPHVSGPNTDSDGDGVGDDCDPHPSTPGDHIGLFSTLEPGTNPFDDITDFSQDPDGLHHIGDVSLFLTRPIGSARIELGFDIVAIIGTGQHQIAVGVERGMDPYYFAELNDNAGGTMHDLAVLSYDSVNGYMALASTDIALLHTGRGIHRLDVDATAHSYATVAGWDGELYTAMASTPQYAGGVKLHYALNGLELVLRYIIVIDSP
jgi:hypothetical protein